jgi:hypothetical protein
MSLDRGMFAGTGPYTFTNVDIAHVTSSLQAALGQEYLASEQVGSSYVLGAGMDLDMVVHVEDIDTAAMCLDEVGYTCNSKDYEGSTDNFKCLRSGLVNVTLVSSERWFHNFVLSSEVCKALRLSEKWQRVAVHRVIMDEEDAETAVAVAKALAK